MLVGDVMTGRGIDQILPHPSPAVLYEGYVKSALGYVRLAENVNGPIPREVPPTYVWGDALMALARQAPDVRIVNLETAVTGCGTPAPKGINYRMSPANVGCLTAGGIDCCVLANNHVLDWTISGLLETLATIHRAGIATTGAGENLASARAPAILSVPDKGRVLVHAIACASSGVPQTWAADHRRAGVNYVDDTDDAALDAAPALLPGKTEPGDIVVCSIHWGSNWGYDIPDLHRHLGQRLIEAGADIVFGHSSHHPKAVEVYRDKLILYGCGDFLNDYEGIDPRGGYRSDLAVAYLPEINTTSGALTRLQMLVFRISNFQLRTADEADREWLTTKLGRECGRFGLAINTGAQGTLEITP